MTEFPKIITVGREIDAPKRKWWWWWANEMTFGKSPVTDQGNPFEYTHYIRLDLHEQAVAALVSDMGDK